MNFYVMNAILPITVLFLGTVLQKLIEHNENRINIQKKDFLTYGRDLIFVGIIFLFMQNATLEEKKSSNLLLTKSMISLQKFCSNPKGNTKLKLISDDLIKKNKLIDSLAPKTLYFVGVGVFLLMLLTYYIKIEKVRRGKPIKLRVVTIPTIVGLFFLVGVLMYFDKG